MRTTLGRVVTVLALVITGALASLSPAFAAGTVSGTVTIAGDATTPVEGYAEFAEYVEGNPPSSWGGVTISDGSFSRSNLPDGSYLLRFRISTMDGTVVYHDQTSDGSPNLAEAVPIVVAGGLVTVAVEVPAIGRVSGTLKNGAGDPMPGIPILRSRLGVGSSTTTDGAGGFDFGYVRAGSINVTVHPQSPWGGTQQFVTVPATGTVDVPLVLPLAGVVEGTITDTGSGEPAAYVLVTAFRRADEAQVGSSLTDGAGAYRIAGLGDEPFSLQYSDRLEGYPTRWNGGAINLAGAPALTVASGTTLTHHEALTQNPDPRSPDDNLSGVVTDDGGDPLAGIEVRAIAEDDSEHRTVSDRSGRWALRDLPDGDYVVALQQDYWLGEYEPDLVPWFPELYPDAWTEVDAVPVTVSGGDHHPGLDVALGRAARLRIPVTGPGGTTDLNAGYRVVDAGTGTTLVDHRPTPFEGPQLNLLVRPGSYRVLVSGRRGQSANAPQLLSQWYGGGVTAAAAPVVQLDALDDLAGAGVSLPAKLRATTAPKVKGTPKVGVRLKATKGRWNLMTDTRFSYRWLRGRTSLARTAAYRPQAADAGKRLTVKVRARNGELVTRVVLTVQIRRR